MKLVKIWEKLGKQPLRVTQHKEAIVFIGDNKYEITKIRYDNGKFIGFEAEPRCEWFSEMIKPKEDKWVVVRDGYGHEYENHQWNGHYWYYFIKNEDGTCDDYPTDIDVFSWRYQE